MYVSKRLKNHNHSLPHFLRLLFLLCGMMSGCNSEPGYVEIKDSAYASLKKDDRRMWSTSCLQEDTNNWVIYQIELGSVSSDIFYEKYSDSRCEDLNITVKLDALTTAGIKSDMPSEGLVDFDITYFNATISQEDAVTIANSNALCGFSDWSRLVEKSVDSRTLQGECQFGILPDLKTNLELFQILNLQSPRKNALWFLATRLPKKKMG